MKFPLEVLVSFLDTKGNLAHELGQAYNFYLGRSMWNYSSVVKPLHFIVATSQDSFGRQIKSNAADAQLLAPTHVPEVIALQFRLWEKLPVNSGLVNEPGGQKWQNRAFWGVNQNTWISSSWATSSVHDWSFNNVILSLSLAWQNFLYFYENCLTWGKGKSVSPL